MKRILFCLTLLICTFVNIMPRLVYGVAQEEFWVNYSFGRRPVPKWENGFLIAYQTHSEPSNVLLFDGSGQPAFQKRIEIPNFGEITLIDVAVSKEGRIAIAGASTTIGAFVAWLTPSGVVERVVNSRDFPLFRICFAPDGTLWGLGSLLDHSRRPADMPDYPTLRHFGKDGEVLQAVLTRNSFVRRTWQEPAAEARLVASADRIGVYSPTAKEWIEVSLSGQILGRWKGIDLPEGANVTGVALLADQSVYVSVQYSSRRGEVQMPSEIFSLDKRSEQWGRFNPTGDEDRLLPMISGADGDKFLIPVGSSKFAWIRP